jgi:hypothetical protein
VLIAISIEVATGARGTVFGIKRYNGAIREAGAFTE